MSFTRRNVIFKPSSKITIPRDYEYAVMQSLYYYVSVTDNIFERFLHEEGYRITNKGYKLFNFTLRFKNATINKHTIDIDENGEIILVLTGKKEVVSKMLKGLLHIKKVKLGESEIPLYDITSDKKFNFQSIMFYKGLSAIIETTQNDNREIVYLSPYESKYYENLANNLKRKYELIYNEEFKGKLFFDIDDPLKIKEKSIKVKDIYSHGYMYDIWVETTLKMQRVIYYLGLGQNNSVGAGCLSYITGRGE